MATISGAESHRRSHARALAAAAIAAGRPLAWFDELYAQADDAGSIPWAELTPNPNLIAWTTAQAIDGAGRRALVVGSGLGDDAEALAALGFDVVAFDISPAAIAWAVRRFPRSRVAYVVADLFGAPVEWAGAFDLVLEAYTLQVLPAHLRPAAAAALAATLRPDGCLLVITRGREQTDPEGEMPWPLTAGELRSLFEHGLACTAFEDYLDDETPPVRRFRATFGRGAIRPVSDG